MHLNSFAEGIKQGDNIEEGQLIGTIGGSAFGRLNGAAVHLHYELYINGKATNPVINSKDLIDPQLLINGTSNNNQIKVIELPEVIVIGKDKRKPPQFISTPTPDMNQQIQIRTPQKDNTSTKQ